MSEYIAELDRILKSITQPVKHKKMRTEGIYGDCTTVAELAAVNRCSELKAALYAMKELDGPVYADAVEYVKALHPSPHSSGNGVMLCMVPDWNSRQQIAVHSGDEPGQIHCTLYYAGKTDGDEQVSAAQIERLKEVGHLLAASCEGPIDAMLNGIARFTGDTEEGDPIVVTVDSPKLPPLYMRMIHLLFDNGGYNFREPNHGYTPHITLGYDDPESPMPIRRWDTRKVQFTNVELWVAGEITSWPLGTAHPFREGMYAEPEGEVANSEEAIAAADYNFKDVFNGDGPGGITPHRRGARRPRIHHPELVERLHRLQKPRETK